MSAAVSPGEPDGVRPPMLAMRGVCKAFGRIRVLTDVDLTLGSGEVHALLGENGAGKSTLMKVLFGIVRPDAGTLSLDRLGVVEVESPRHALSLGIGLVSQELSLVPQLDVAQNIFLGQTAGLGFVPRGRHRQAAAAILRTLAPHLRVDTPVLRLGMADRQLVEISRTLARGGRIIAFDEPTSSLTPQERDALFKVIRDLRDAGKAIIYISHRMEEIRAIADRYTVLRDGRVVASGAMAERSDQDLNELIAGRELSQALERRPPAAAASQVPRLELRQLSTERLASVDLAVHPGEIVGLAGLVGSGRSAILRAAFGLDARTGGEVLVAGAPVDVADPQTAMAVGIALIPEDRRRHAIVPMMSVEQNFGLASQRRFARLGALRGGARRAEARRYVSDLQIRPATIATPIANLSGGNQQKVVIARWLATGARILMFDEPTRGIDVGAKAEIYGLLRRLAAEGAAVLVVSSELPELLLLSNRIGVVNRGRLTHMLDNSSRLNEDLLMRYASAGGALMTHDATQAPAAPAPPARASSRLNPDLFRQASMLIGCVALFAVFSLLTSSFYQPANLVDIMLQSAINAVIAVGMTLVIITRGIDLSVGSVVGLSSMVAADLMNQSLALGIAAGLLVGLVCGALNGLLIAKLKLPDFIVTLGTLSVYRGAALIYTNGQPIYGLPQEFRDTFNGRLLDIPTPVILALVIAGLAFLLVRFTALGEQIVAVGGNEEAARLSGINIDRVKIVVYTLSGLLSTLAGFVLIARIGAAEPIGGNGFELQAIGSAVIGGASLFGGIGNPLGSLVGALTLGGLQNGLTLMNVPSFWQYVASGTVVILAVYLDRLARPRR